MKFRLRILLSALTSLAAALAPISAIAITPWSPWTSYLAELRRQCPSKQLDRLDPHDLRATLNGFLGELPPEPKARIGNAVDAGCSAGPYPHTATCDNSAAIAAITREGRLAAAVSKVCASFVCDGQSDCKAVPR